MTPAKPKARISAVEMRDSGVEWLGEIPAHWDVKRLRHVASVRASNVDKTFKESETEISLLHSREIYYHEFLGNEISFLDATATNQQIEMFELRKGDVVVTKDSVVRGRIAIPAYVQFDFTGVLPDYLTAIIRSFPNLSDGRFLARILASKPLLHQFVVAAQGVTISHLSKQKIGNVILVVPPLAEQRAIAAYLDRETARIDALITKTEALNALLREKRVALISQAVTKGLDADVEMKDSGVEWLGEIPAHWDVKRLRHVVQTSPKKSELRFTSGELEVSFLPMPAIGEQGALDLSQIKHIADVYNGYTYFCDNDVIVAKITPCFENGKGAIVRGLKNGIGFGTTELFVLRPAPGADTKFLYYLTVSSRFRKIGTVSMQGAAGQQRVTDLFIKDYVLGLPPLHEQRAIAAQLDRETAKIDNLIRVNDELVALLREKRTALISAAVTGKIAVDLSPAPTPPQSIGEGSAVAL